MTAPPTPGWYPDPSGAPQQRYWDGRQWTSATQFGGTASSTSAGTSATATAALVVGGLCVLAALVVGSVLLVRGMSSDVIAQSRIDEASAGIGDLAPPLPLAPPEPPAGVVAGACTFDASGRAADRPVGPPSVDDVITEGAVEVTLTTSLGTIVIRGDAARTPCALASLRALAGSGFYDGTSCHRLTTSGIFVLQCGDPTGTGAGGPGYLFPDEALEGATYPRGTVAMANSGPDTNGSQFFIVYADTDLPPSYTPLGVVTAGLEVVDRVASGGVEEGLLPGDGRPRTGLEIRSVSVTS